MIDLQNQVRHFPGHPAIFPNLQYALAQIDELKGLVIKHFEDAYRQTAQAQQVTQAQPALEQATVAVQAKEAEVKDSETKKKKTAKLGEDAA